MVPGKKEAWRVAALPATPPTWAAAYAQAYSTRGCDTYLRHEHSNWRHLTMQSVNLHQPGKHIPGEAWDHILWSCQWPPTTLSDKKVHWEVWRRGSRAIYSNLPKASLPFLLRLARHFLALLCANFSSRKTTLNKGLMDKLSSTGWKINGVFF